MLKTFPFFKGEKNYCRYSNPKTSCQFLFKVSATPPRLVAPPLKGRMFIELSLYKTVIWFGFCYILERICIYSDYCNNFFKITNNNLLFQMQCFIFVIKQCSFVTSSIKLLEYLVCIWLCVYNNIQSKHLRM